MQADVAVGIVFSGALLALVAAWDPKRRRSVLKVRGRRAPQLTPGIWRQALGWLSVLPAVWLIASDQIWGLLVWAGAVCTVGWLIPQAFTWRSRSEESRGP